mmetsp:Transcript_53682/g.125116  ORF Transcript_53682/g.125116 Transcript_53682/m.125116 type:complete len:254 (-) Transcript_53682:59-820(-)
MPPLYPSPGPFPTHRALAAVSKDEVRQFYYQTTSDRALYERPLSTEIRGENYLNVHAIGQRNTKYLQWTRNLAPLTNRLSCHHTEQYVPLPLGDNKINSDLAASFKAGWQKSKGGSNAVMDSTTLYEDVFVGCGTDELAAARQPNKKPPQKLTSTVCPPGDLLESKSHEQRHFQAPRQDILKAERVPPPRQCLVLGGSAIDPPKKSAYKREHVPLRTLSSPEIHATRNERPVAQLVNLDVLQLRRNPYMSPGQ